MEFKFTARHFDAKPDLREAAADAAAKLQRFYANIVSTEVILSYEKAHANDSIKVAEFIVHVQDHTLVAKEESGDYYKSLHDGAEKIVRQLTKLKTKMAVA
jgi:ribosomal subunit interface protein